MSLIVFTGPMFSGKTTKMIMEVTRYSDLSKLHRPLIINHSFDNRNQEEIISSHSSLYKGLGQNVDVVMSSKLSTIDVSNYQVIGIDECNFFTDLAVAVGQWVDSGKHVICAGLDGNSNMEAFGHGSSENFGQINLLLPIADEFIKLRAICSLCVNELMARKELITPLNATAAPFTDKIAGDPHVEIEIGGAEKYIAVCRKHHSKSRK